MSGLIAVGLALGAGAYVAWPWRDHGGGELPHELDGGRLQGEVEAEAAAQRGWSVAAGELEDVVLDAKRESGPATPEPSEGTQQGDRA